MKLMNVFSVFNLTLSRLFNRKTLYPSPHGEGGSNPNCWRVNGVRLRYADCHYKKIFLMKKFALIVSAIRFSLFTCIGQEIPPSTQQQLENLTDINQGEIEDDSYLQQLEHFKKHPLNLNEADANDLKELIFLTDLQIANLISYRNLLGKFVSIYELQSIPAWDVLTIKKILLYVVVADPVSIKEDLKKRFKGGDNNLLFRFSEILEQSKGFDHSTSGTKYFGGR